MPAVVTGARPVRVNLGCGDCYAPDWTNVDHGSPHRFDVDADLTALPLPPELDRIGEVYAGHVLEHLTPAELAVLLVHLRDRMAPHGQIMVVGPDVTRARAMHARGELSAEWLDLVVKGGDRWPGDRHQWECEPGRLVAALSEAGWRDAREVPVLSVSQIDWPIVSYDEWQCAVTAYA